MRHDEIAFAVGCALWWCASLWVQIAPKNKGLLQVRRWDPIFLLQSYRFFSPRPQFVDYIVEYRFATTDRPDPPWQPIDLYISRSWRSMIWDPEMLRAQSLYLLVGRLAHTTEHRGEEAVAGSAAFLQLAHHLESSVRPPKATALQVQILTGLLFDPATPRTSLFRSSWIGLGK